MNKEIKIKMIGQLLDYVETEEKAKELIDYITNLQEENERLNNMTQEIKEKLDDYFCYDYENESQARLDTINEINHTDKDN